MILFYTILLALSAFIFSYAANAGLIWWTNNKKLFTEQSTEQAEQTKQQSIAPHSGGIAVSLSAIGFLFIAGSPNIITLSMLGLGLILFICDINKLKLSSCILTQIIFSIIVSFSIKGLVFQGLLPELIDKSLAALTLFYFLSSSNFINNINKISSVEITSISLGLVAIFFAQQFAIPHIEPLIQQILSPIIKLLSQLPNQWIPSSIDTLKPISPSFAVDGFITFSAILGFLVFNKYPYQISFGKIGNSMINLFLGYLLLQLSANGYFAAALILPSYYIINTKFIIISRILQRKNPWEQHQEHIYQEAKTTNNSTSSLIFIFNIILITLSCVSLLGGEIALFCTIFAYIIAMVFYTILKLTQKHNNIQ